MLDLLDKNAILTLYKHGIPKKKIASQLGISRKTVIKYIKEDEELNRELLEQEAGSVEQHEIMEKIAGKPQSKAKNKRKSRRKYTDEIDKKIDAILEDEKRKDKIYGKNHKIGRTAKDIYQMLIEDGHDIAYSTVCLRLREKRDKKPKNTFIKQRYEPGYRAEFDFGERKITIAGKVQKVYIAVICSAATNYREFYVYHNSKKEVFVDALVRFFNRIGVYETMVFDNMKNVVKKFVGKNLRELTDTVLTLSNYYGFEIVLTNPYSGNEKGSVEVSVKTICHDLFANRDQFESWEELINYVREVKKKMNEDKDINKEIPYLNTSKPPFEAAVINERRVNSYGFIRDDNNDYSVPEVFEGAMVTVKRYPHTIEIFYRGELITKHDRIYGVNEYSVKLEHYLKTMLRKPGALVNSVALDQVPKLKQLYSTNYSENPKEFLEILMDNKDKMDTDELYEILIRKGKISIDAENRSRIEEESENQLSSVSAIFYGGQNE